MGKEAKFILTPALRKLALKTMEAKGTYSAVAKALGISMGTLRQLRYEVPEVDEEDDEQNAEPSFESELTDAREAAMDAAEERLLELGRDGVDKPVFQGGQHVGDIREYSVPALQTILRAHKPNRYNVAPVQRLHIEVNTNTDRLSDDELERIIESETVKVTPVNKTPRLKDE